MRGPAWGHSASEEESAQRRGWEGRDVHRTLDSSATSVYAAVSVRPCMHRKPMALPLGIPSLSHMVTTAAYTDLIRSTREECVAARAMACMLSSMASAPGASG